MKFDITHFQNGRSLAEQGFYHLTVKDEITKVEFWSMGTGHLFT